MDGLMLGMTFWWNSNHIWLCAEIGRTGWSQTPVSERACGFDSHQSYKHTFVVERQTRYTKDVESERTLRVRIPPRVQYGSMVKLVVHDRFKLCCSGMGVWVRLPLELQIGLWCNGSTREFGSLCISSNLVSPTTLPVGREA